MSKEWLAYTLRLMEGVLMIISVTPCLSKILKERDLLQTQPAEMAGIPQPAVSRFDKSTQHKHTHLFAIAHVLGVNVEDLFEVKIEEESDDK